MKEILLAICAGGVGVEVIRNTFDYFRHRRERKDKKEDMNLDDFMKRTDDFLKKLSDKIEALTEGDRLIMYDRIKYLAQSYIRDGEVDFDDRRILHLMHDIYHYKLGGNGDLDLLMGAVDDLRLKKE